MLLSTNVVNSDCAEADIASLDPAGDDTESSRDLESSDTLADISPTSLSAASGNGDGFTPLLAESNGTRYVCSETGVVVHLEHARRGVRWNCVQNVGRKRRRRTSSDALPTPERARQPPTSGVLRMAAQELSTEGKSPVQFLRSVCTYCDKEFPTEEELTAHLQTCCISQKAQLSVRSATLEWQLIADVSTRVQLSISKIPAIVEYSSCIADSVRARVSEKVDGRLDLRMALFLAEKLSRNISPSLWRCT